MQRARSISAACRIGILIHGTELRGSRTVLNPASPAFRTTSCNGTITVAGCPTSPRIWEKWGFRHIRGLQREIGTGERSVPAGNRCGEPALSARAKRAVEWAPLKRARQFTGGKRTKKTRLVPEARLKGCGLFKRRRPFLSPADFSRSTHSPTSLVSIVSKHIHLS